MKAKELIDKELKESNSDKKKILHWGISLICFKWGTITWFFKQLESF